MNHRRHPFRIMLCSIAVMGAISASSAAEPAPVEIPALQHYAALWERSIFTTKDLPSPDTPAGPIFTDNLGLSGIYEVDGQVVAVLVDRTTSQFSEARIGSENEQGIKIRKVQPGTSMEKTRVQLQKGDIAGWVTFSDASNTPAAEADPQIRPAQPAHAPAATPLLPAPAAPQQPEPPHPARRPQPVSDVPLPPP
jgi:hypothetical protein